MGGRTRTRKYAFLWQPPEARGPPRPFCRRHAADEAPASGLANMRFPGDLPKPAADEAPASRLASGKRNAFPWRPPEGVYLFVLSMTLVSSNCRHAADAQRGRRDRKKTNRKTKTFSRRHAADEAPASGLASMRFPGGLLKPAARPDHLAAGRDAADETCTAGGVPEKP